MKKVLGILFLMSTAAFAKNLTLEEAIELSLNNSKKIEISSRNKKIGDINLGIAFKAALPSVTYEGGYNRNTQKEKCMEEKQVLMDMELNRKHIKIEMKKAVIQAKW